MSYNETVRPDDEVMVDCQFRTLLDERFDTQKMYDYRKLFPTDWLKMMQGFEAKKCAFLKNETKIRLTGGFVSWLNDYRSPSMKCFAEGVVKIVDDKYLSVSSHAMRSLFQPLIEAIKGCLRDTVLKKPPSTTVFLVGGLSESPLLQKEIKNVFSGQFSDVMTRGASIAVVHGAVILGKRAAAESRRVVSRTYGTDCSLRFVLSVLLLHSLVYSLESIAPIYPRYYSLQALGQSLIWPVRVFAAEQCMVLRVSGSNISLFSVLKRTSF